MLIAASAWVRNRLRIPEYKSEFLNNSNQYPMNYRNLPAIAALLIGASVALPKTSAQAASVISEEFTSPLGGIPTGWTAVIRGGAANDGFVGVQQINASLGNGLQYQRISGGSSNSSAAVYYTGTTGTPSDAKMMDFSSEITLRLGATLGVSSSIGMMVRTQSLSYSFSGTSFGGYYVAVTNTGLGIYSNPSDNSVPGTLESNFAVFVLSANTDYLFRVSALGSMISAEIWDSTGTTQYASVSYGSANEVAGYTGLRSGYGNSSQSAYFRDLNMTVVPEPGVLGLLALAGVWGLNRVLRRRA